MAQQATEKFALVTGASSGQIGAALVVAFQQKNFTVFAGVRDPAKAPEALSKLPRVHLLQIDLTSEQSVAQAVDSVEAQTAGRGIDVLVNSARVEFVMPVVDTALSEGKRCFDINIWGTFSMIKAFTPQLIRNKGTVVNLSSMGALVNSPWIGESS